MIKSNETKKCFQHRDAGAAGGGQPLSSPGSCLEEFRARPFIECRGQGTCNFFSTAVSYWLATIKDHEQFRKPLQQTLKTDHTSRVSRCAVCIRRRVVEDSASRSHGSLPSYHSSGGLRQPTASFHPDDASNEIEGGSQGYYHHRSSASDWRRFPPQRQQQQQQQQQQHLQHLQQQRQQQQQQQWPQSYTRDRNQYNRRVPEHQRRHGRHRRTHEKSSEKQ